MLKRTATGALIAGLTYLALYFSGIPQVAKGFAAVLCAFAVYEIFCATGRLESEGTFVLTLLAAFVLPYGRLPYEKEIIAVLRRRSCGAAADDLSSALPAGSFLSGGGDLRCGRDPLPLLHHPPEP